MRLAPAASGVLLLSLVAVSGDRAAGQQAQPQPFQFHLMEAIPDVPRHPGGAADVPGVRPGVCQSRAAYSRTCNQLVTEEMAPAYLHAELQRIQGRRDGDGEPALGDRRKTPPVEFGRMEPTSSDQRPAGRT